MYPMAYSWWWIYHNYKIISQFDYPRHLSHTESVLSIYVSSFL